MNKCTVCSKQFATPSGLKRHAHTHTKHKCYHEGCTARFRLQEELDAHLSTHWHPKILQGTDATSRKPMLEDGVMVVPERWKFLP